MNKPFSPAREYTSRIIGTSGLSEKRFPVLSIGLAILVLLAGGAVVIRSGNGTAFPSRILGVLKRTLVGTHAGPAASPPSGTVLWSADMETSDLSQWSLPDGPGGPNAGGGVFDSGTSVASVDAVSVAHSGLHSAKLYINTLNSPGVSTSGARLFRWLEPQTHSDLYYSVWYYFPQRYTPNANPPWWNVFQWKSKRGETSDPFFALNVGNRSDGSMYVYLYDQNAKASYSQTIKNIPIGQWFHIEAFYKCAGDKTGHVTFWQDGTQLFDVSKAQTRYADGNCSWSVNNYAASLNPPTATIYVDDAAICTGGRCP
jgi:Polysaccharide lyase